MDWLRHTTLAAALTLTGCAFTTMDPAHRLDAGEVVAQGAIDEPGAIYIPRVSGAVTYGIGGKGDIGAHLGTTLFNVNGGASLRYYAGERWYLGMQGDVLATTFEDTLLSSGSRFVIASVTPRFGRLLVEDSEHFYGGVQAQALLPLTVDNDTDVNLTNEPGFAVGGYLGLAYDTPGNFDYQVELTGSPIGLFRGIEDSTPDAYTFTPVPIVQIGFAVQYRAEDEKQPRPRPSETPADDNRIR